MNQFKFFFSCLESPSNKETSHGNRLIGGNNSTQMTWSCFVTCKILLHFPHYIDL